MPSASFTPSRHFRDERSLPDDRVTALIEDDKLRLRDVPPGGLALYDPRFAEFSPFKNESAHSESLPDNHQVSLY